MYPPRELRPDPIPLRSLHATPSAKFSIVTPVLNQSEFVEATIQSVLQQRYPLLEYMVIDGGSKDGTQEVVSKYTDQLAYFESAKDSGQADAINKGFRRATGDIYAWINADDLLLPGTLALVAGFFDENPLVDVVYGNRVVIDERGAEIGRWALPGHSDRLLSWLDVVPQETLFWRASAWEKVNKQVDASFQFAMDWDLLVRFRDAGLKIVHLPRFLGAFRAHAKQKTVAQINDVGVFEMERIQRRCLGYKPSKGQLYLAAAPYVVRHVFTSHLDSLRRTFCS